MLDDTMELWDTHGVTFIADQKNKRHPNPQLKNSILESPLKRLRELEAKGMVKSRTLGQTAEVMLVWTITEHDPYNHK